VLLCTAFHDELGDLSSSSYRVFFWDYRHAARTGHPPAENVFITFAAYQSSFAARPARSGPGLPATIAWRLTANNCPDRQTRLAVYYGRPQAFW
jgi:hypothetical protein